LTFAAQKLSLFTFLRLAFVSASALHLCSASSCKAFVFAGGWVRVFARAGDVIGRLHGVVACKKTGRLGQQNGKIMR